MGSRIRLEKATSEGSILFTLERNLESKFVNAVVMYLIFVPQPHLFFFSFEFTMCNPPFYSSPEEIARSASEKDSEPYAVSFFPFNSAKGEQHSSRYVQALISK